MKRTILLLALLISSLSALDFYLGADYTLPTAMENLSKDHPDYDRWRSRHPMDDLRHRYEPRDSTIRDMKSAEPDYMSMAYTLRAGAYLSNRNRAGVEVRYIKSMSDADWGKDITPTARSERDLTYTNLMATFSQELWIGIFIDAKLGWGWRWYDYEHEYDYGSLSTEIEDGGFQYSGPAAGFSFGWNQNIWWDLSVAAHIDWDWQFYIGQDIKNTRIFSGGVGLNWGLKYHDKTPGKS